MEYWLLLNNCYKGVCSRGSAYVTQYRAHLVRHILNNPAAVRWLHVFIGENKGFIFLQTVALHYCKKSACNEPENSQRCLRGFKRYPHSLWASSSSRLCLTGYTVHTIKKKREVINNLCKCSKAVNFYWQWHVLTELIMAIITLERRERNSSIRQINKI